MSNKTDHLSRIASPAAFVALVATAILFLLGPAAVSQQPPIAPPLAGGFKIDFGDASDTAGPAAGGIDKRDNRSADEIVRSLMKADAAREQTATGSSPDPLADPSPDPSSNPLPGSVAAAIPAAASTANSAAAAATLPAATATENAVPGLSPKALPIGFPATAPPSSPSKGPATLIQAGDMIGFSRELGDGVQAITIINASRRWMAVYHIDTSGQIRLTSSRPLDADFTIQFNATAPLPEDIRRLQGK